MDISVIVPVHNSEIYLEACLKTLHEQTHQAAEFIVIDDGSDDKSGAICDAFAAVDKRFVVIHQKPAGTLVTRKELSPSLRENGASVWMLMISCRLIEFLKLKLS